MTYAEQCAEYKELQERWIDRGPRVDDKVLSSSGHIYVITKVQSPLKNYFELMDAQGDKHEGWIGDYSWFPSIEQLLAMLPGGWRWLNAGSNTTGSWFVSIDPGPKLPSWDTTDAELKCALLDAIAHAYAWGKE